MNTNTHYVASPRVLLVAAAFLAIFGGVGAWSFIGSLHPLLWESIPCEVLAFHPTDDPKSDHPFAAEVKFRFRIGEKNYEGTQLGIAGWKDARKQLQEWQRFDLDGAATCYLPDGDPVNAVLYRPSPQTAGLAFVVFSGCIGWILYHAHRGRDLPTVELSAKVLPAVGILFGGAGLFMLLTLSLPVWIESFQVRSWQETPAKIIWSESRVNGQGSKQTRRADICYEYVAAGRTWRNNRLYPGKLSAANSGGTDTLIGKHPPGSTVTCRIDPRRPERAVLFASTGWSALLTLFPLPFLAVGGLVLKSLVRSRKASKLL
jgi:hypothetical protein